MTEENLEHEVENKESEGFMKKALKVGFNLALAGATTALGIYTAGITAPIIAAAVGSGVLVGKVWKGDSGIVDIINDSLRAYSTINTIIFPVIGFGNLTYPLIDNYDLAGKALRTLYAMTVHHAMFMVSYRATDHMYKNYFNPTGIMDSIAENYLQSHLRLAAGFAPGWALTSNGITELALGGLNIPIFALNAFPLLLYDTLNPIQKQEEKTEEHPVMNPALGGAHG